MVGGGREASVSHSTYGDHVGFDEGSSGNVPRRHDDPRDAVTGVAHVHHARKGGNDADDSDDRGNDTKHARHDPKDA